MHPPLPSIIYQALLADKRAPTGKLHCSSHAWWPLRFTQLSQVIDTDETDIGSLITMGIGTLTHEWLANYMEKNPAVLGEDWELCATEWDLTPHLPDGWTGTADYVFVHRPTDMVVVSDLKTSKPEALAYLNGQPKDSHWIQVSCYHAAISRFYAAEGVSVHPDISICYMPKGKDSRQNTIQPVVVSKAAIPAAQVWANLTDIKTAVDRYVIEYNKTGELDNKCLAPMPLQSLKIGWNKTTANWDVVSRDGWEVEFIGAQFGEQLCPRGKALKVGHWNLNGSWVPRKGVFQPDYDSIPRPSQLEVEKRRGV